jgi:hypothetical protein
MIEINANQVEQIKNIETMSRVDAMEQLSNIVNSSLSDQFRWTKTSKCLKVNDCRIDLTTRKNKDGHVIIKELNIFQEDNKGKILAWNTIDIQK